MTYTCVVCGHTYTEEIPKADAPFIEGEEGLKGWNAIEEQINTSQKNEEVKVNMNGFTVLLGKVVETLKEKDAVLVLDMEENITWTIKGNSVEEGNINDIDLGVTVDNAKIPQEQIQSVVKSDNYKTLSLKHNGKFGFTAELTINVGKDNMEQIAKLYYYNEVKECMEFVCENVVDKDGNVVLPFTHASDYVISIEEKPVDENPSEDETQKPDKDENSFENETQKPDKDENQKPNEDTNNPQTGDNNAVQVIVYVMMLLVGTVVGFADIRRRKVK